jgi:hypothetical protein
MINQGSSDKVWQAWIGQKRKVTLMYPVRKVEFWNETPKICPYGISISKSTINYPEIHRKWFQLHFQDTWINGQKKVWIIPRQAKIQSVYFPNDANRMTPSPPRTIQFISIGRSISRPFAIVYSFRVFRPLTFRSYSQVFSVEPESFYWIRKRRSSWRSSQYSRIFWISEVSELVSVDERLEDTRDSRMAEAQCMRRQRKSQGKRIMNKGLDR